MAAISISHFKTKFQQDLTQIGLAPTIKDYFFRAVNRVTPCKVIRAMSITQVNPKFMETDPKYTGRFLTPSELENFSRQPELELNEAFLRDALGKGDECFAILDGGNLAAYGWYSNAPTIVDDELRLRFHRDYIYMYKGFTHTDYRGQRLHAVGMTRALDAYLRRGFKGIVSYVEETNQRSLKSVYRMGYADFGKVYFIRVFGKYVIHCSAGCREQDFIIESL
jgi:ribosomal protein S18 acetylase RimI-like enzyme